MKRRGFLKALAAALAFAPAVAEQVAEAFDDGRRSELVEVRQVRPPVVETLDDDEAALEALLNRYRNDPAVQEALDRRIRERLERLNQIISSPERFTLGDDDTWR